MATAVTRTDSTARRVTAAAIGVLVLAALVAGGGVFVLMQQAQVRAIDSALAGALQDRRQLLDSRLRLQESRAEDVAQLAELRTALGNRNAQLLEAVLRRAVGGEVLAVSVLSASGDLLASAGAPLSSHALAFPLATPLASEFLWAGRPVLRTRVEARRDGRTLGVVVVEQVMRVVADMMAAEVGTWRSGEIALCFARDDRLHCFPQRRNAQVVQVRLRDAEGGRLPAALAAEGREGVVRTRDSLGYDVVAAYGPVGDLGLLMAVEVDADEISAPLRRQLPGVILLALGAIGLGVWLLRRNVQPLVAQVSLAEAEARVAQEQMQKIADNVPAVVGYVDAQQRYRFANRGYADWFGLDPGNMVGRRMDEVWDADRFDRAKPYVERALQGEVVGFDAAFGSGGTRRTVHTSYVPDWGPNETVRGMFVLSSDVTEITRARKALDAAMQRLDLALDASRVTVWETDLRNGETVLSEAWADLLGRTPGQTRTMVAELAALVHPSEIGQLSRESRDVVLGKREEYAVEHRVRAEGGHWKWILSRGKVIERDPVTGHALRMMGTNLDITARKAGELRLEQLANYDTLTGAANRNLFSDRLKQAIARCRRGKGRAALLYLDIDKFKRINDSLGHAAGDALLKEFAARLMACVRATDTVGRMGGDEFAVLLEDVSEEDAPARIAEKILEAMRQPVDADGKAVVVTTSIGLALFDGDADPEALARRADAALYEAKAAGRNTYRVGA
ncbi:MAG: diguanylate cyclase domain-containing protein [Betaproteobacteria bacterium]